MEKLLPFVQLHVNVLLGMLCFVAIHVQAVHMSAVLHCLSSLSPALFQLRPNLPHAHVVDDDNTCNIIAMPMEAS